MILNSIHEPESSLEGTKCEAFITRSVSKNSPVRKFKEVRSEPSLIDLEKEFEESAQHLNIEQLPIIFRDDCWYTPTSTPYSNKLDKGFEMAVMSNNTGPFLKATRCLVPNEVSDEEKNEIIKQQNREIINMQIAYHSLTLKYEGRKNELENFKKIVADHIKDNNEKITTETRKEMEAELLEKQHTIAELTHELNNYKELTKSLRNKLTESNKEIVAVEQSQVDIEELKEARQKEKDKIEKIEKELSFEREKNNKLIVQIKELIQNCDKYAQKQKRDENNLIARNKQLKENLLMLKRENNELRHQIAECESIAREYEKHNVSIKFRSTLQTLKNQIPVFIVNFFYYLIG